MSMHSLISRKATNKIVQLQTNLVEFLKPVIHQGDLFVRRNFGVYGNANIVGNVTVGGNVNVDGTILAKTFLPGQIINVAMLNNTDLYQNPVTINQGATSNIFTISYTPQYPTSYLIIEFQSVYSLGGGGADEAYAYLNVNDDSGHRISQTYQKWTASQGGGDRSGVLFPLIGRYTNTNTSSKVISVDLYNHTDADPITVNSDISTWLKITEIGR